MRDNFPVVLDANVLLPMPLADTLLRLGALRLYLPRWSEEIMAEVSRNLVEKFGKTTEQARHRHEQIRQHFPESWVEGYHDLIPVLRNEPKDRHVLAVAIRSGSELIVTYNQKDFPADALDPYDVSVIGPSTFLANLHELEPQLVHQCLQQQATAIGKDLGFLLERLAVNVPAFVARFRAGMEAAEDNVDPGSPW